MIHSLAFPTVINFLAAVINFVAVCKNANSWRVYVNAPLCILCFWFFLLNAIGLTLVNFP